MSFRLSKWVAKQARNGLINHPIDLAVLYRLADYANEPTLECYPSQLLISREIKYDVTTIEKSIKRLKKMKIIFTKKLGKSNRYFFPAFEIEQKEANFKDTKFEFVNAKKEEINNEQCA